MLASSMLREMEPMNSPKQTATMTCNEPMPIKMKKADAVAFNPTLAAKRQNVRRKDSDHGSNLEADTTHIQ